MRQSQQHLRYVQRLLAEKNRHHGWMMALQQVIFRETNDGKQTIALIMNGQLLCALYHLTAIPALLH
jgi:hypothetical protein